MFPSPPCRPLILLALAALLAPAAARADSRRFVLQRGKSRAVFVSDAVLDTFEGHTRALRGEVRVDLDDLRTTRGHVAFPVASLRTGIELRDEHLRGDAWLDAARFPSIRFEITQVKVKGSASLQPGQTANVEVHGKITIHGVTRPVVAKLKVERVAGQGRRPERLHVHGRFQIKLTDFGISVPLPVRLKVSNEILVKVDLWAHAAPPPAPAQQPPSRGSEAPSASE